MIDRLIKIKYLRKIQQALAKIDINFYFNDIDLDEVSEETLFIDCWDITEMSQLKNKNLYMLWCERMTYQAMMEEDLDIML